MNKTKSHNLEQGAFLLFMSAIAAKLISALFKIPLSSEYCLGDLGFGYFASAHDLITPIHTLAVSGLPVAVSRLVSECVANNSKNKIWSIFLTSRRIIVLISLLCGAFILLMAYPFVLLTDETGQSIYSIFALIPAVIFCLITSVYRGHFEGVNNMTPAAVSDVIESFSKLIIGFTLAFITVKITGDVALGSAAAVLGISMGAFSSLLFLNFRFKNHRKDFGLDLQKKHFHDKGLAKTVLAMAFPVAIASLAGSMISLIDTLTVRTQLADTITEYPDVIQNMYGTVIASFNENSSKILKTEEIPTFLYGIRSKAYTLYNLLPTFTVALGVGAVPEITQAFSKNDKSGVKRSVGSVLRLTAFFALPAGIGMLSLSGGVFSLLYGTGGSNILGSKMLEIYSVAGILVGLSVVLSCVLQALNRQNRVVFNMIFGIVVKVLLNILLSAIPSLNIFGSIYATLICFGVIFILNLFSLLKCIRIDKAVCISLLKIFVSALICGVTAFAISCIGDGKFISLAAIMGAVAVYFAMIIFTKAFNKGDIERFPGGKYLAKIVK